IAGDAAIDWYEERITHYPEDDTRKGRPPQNWRLRPGTDWHCSPGGVLLLKQMIAEGGRNPKFCPAQLDIIAFPRLAESNDDVGTAATPKLIHSLAVIQPDPEEESDQNPKKSKVKKKINPDDQSWRAKEFLGFRGPSTLATDLFKYCF